jgi:hypothetical protein
MDRPLDGFIYGQPPSKLPDVPDVVGMLEAADVPLGDGGNLPHTLEWYAGAKERQAARNLEMETLVVSRNDLRNSWCDMAVEAMNTWIGNVEDLANLQEPQDINSLLARTVASRPYDTEEITKLKAIVTGAEARRAELREANASIIERLRTLEEKIHEKKHQDEVEEEARAEKERLRKEHKARSEEALRKAQSMMEGENDEGGDAEEAEDEDEPADTTEVSGGPLPPLPSPTLPSQSPGTPGRGTPPGIGTPGRRTQELPPLTDPPLPPTLQ